MLRFKRPLEPDNFEGAVATARADARKAVNENRKPSFPNKWGDFKPHFSERQHGRCGYCEVMVIGGQFGDVEHYAPKSVVNFLAEPGRELPNASNTTGRKMGKFATEGGYWWLAYSWKNYLLSCQICNQQWKKTLFPVKGGDDQRQMPPSEDVKEKPLLLNPFGRKRPETHLVFGDLGEVMPRNDSEVGEQTISVCGLDRPSLRSMRGPVVRQVLQSLHDLAELPDDATDRERHRIVRDLVARGEADFPTFPGVVRCVVKEETGLKWKELVEYRDVLEAGLP